MAELQTTPRTTTARRAGPNSTARAINVALGVWLFISAFVWPHSRAQFFNTWVMGVVFVVIALIAFTAPVARYINTLAAIWLFISAFLLRDISNATVWNNALVAIAIFIVSLVPAAAGSDFYGRPRTPQGV